MRRADRGRRGPGDRHAGTSFRLVALSADHFTPLFALSDEELAARGARRLRADAKPGYPCRVSLADAEPGEEVILLHHLHHDVPSPYRAAGPIYVRAGAATAAPGAGEIPPMLRARPQSIRAYDGDAMMVAAEIAAGEDVRPAIERLLERGEVEYLHLHNAGPGCYNCRVERV